MLSKKNGFVLFLLLLFLFSSGIYSAFGQDQQPSTKTSLQVIRISLTDWMALQKLQAGQKEQIVILTEQYNNSLILQEQLSEQLRSSQESARQAVELSNSLSRDLSTLTQSTSVLEKKIQTFLDTALEKIATLEQQVKNLKIIVAITGTVAAIETVILAIDYINEQAQ